MKRQRTRQQRRVGSGQAGGANSASWYDADLFRTAHDALTIPHKEQTIRIDRTVQEMRDAFQDGLRSQQTMADRALQDMRGRSVVDHLCIGAYLYGMGYRGASEDGRLLASVEHVKTACLGTKHFVRAILRLTHWNRLWIYQELREHPVLLGGFAGACSEAHAAYVLLRAGYEVHSSTTDEDVNLGTDLLVPFEDRPGGAAVQVKTVSQRRGISFLHVRNPWVERALGDAQAPIEFAQKVSRLSEGLGALYEPVIALVGTEENSRSHFEDPWSIELGRTFLRMLSAA